MVEIFQIISRKAGLSKLAPEFHYFVYLIHHWVRCLMMNLVYVEKATGELTSCTIRGNSVKKFLDVKNTLKYF